MVGKGFSLISIIIAFIVSIISAYLFSLKIIKFETLIWIVIGSMTIVIILTYQEIKNELESQRWEQQRLNEKLKIYKRLSKVEEVLKI